jgi:hypothetical protein
MLSTGALWVGLQGRIGGEAQGLHNGLDAELVTVFRYQTHLRGGDFPVDALRSLECDV